MAASTSATASYGGPSDPTRRTAFVAGVLYLITFLSSIPAVFLLDPALTNPEYILGSGAEGSVRLGAFLDLVNVLALIGTAVALFSVVKRQHEGFALGFVTTRMLEAAVLSVGILTMLSIVTLRGSGTGDAAMVTVGQSLVAVRDWSFIIGTGMAAANALMLGTLMYRSRLVPRVIPALGLIGVVTFGSWVVGNVLGVTETGTPWQSIGVAPIFVWELALGLWMAFKGFRAPAVAALYGASEPLDRTVVAIAAASAKAGVA
jgi:hypothetical protein